MDDAVEMIKVRNERIRELETISLKTQSELWALEAQADEETNTGVEEPDHGALKGIPVGERAPAEQIDVLLQVAQDAHNLAEAALPLITGTEEQLSSQLAALEEGTSGLQEAKEMMETCLKIIQECSSRLEIREQAREGRDT